VEQPRTGLTVSTSDVFERIDVNKESSISMLREFVSRPSVSASGQGIRDCAAFVQKLLSDLGANPKMYDVGEGSPVVAGEIRSKRNPGKTVLFYNHYDVQPPEPLELWDTPPFEPSIRGGRMYGRGAADDKGELTGRINLTKAFLEARGDVPCNFKFLIEGEEEIGSVHLSKYLARYPELFEADSVIWEFGGVDPKERPNVVLGVKGIFYVQLTSTLASRDAHSSLGAIVENPAWRLVAALNTIKKGDRILIPGWYDDVRPLTREEKAIIMKQPYDAQSVKKDLGIKEFIGRMGVEEAKLALVGKPTCTICGLYSGYTGPGSKTVLPKEAFAKVDFRLVPDQDPDDLHRKLVKHLAGQGFGDVKVTYAEGEKAKRTSHKAPIAVAARGAAEEVYSTKPVVTVSSAGTGPMYLFKAPCVAIGGGSAFSHAHAPNENLRLDLFVKGMKWVATTVDRFAAS
jgi:acetylornithine deacetylase/succinyl-diaminopimelate desuccinylase-like protein